MDPVTQWLVNPSEHHSHWCSHPRSNRHSRSPPNHWWSLRNSPIRLIKSEEADLSCNKNHGMSHVVPTLKKSHHMDSRRHAHTTQG